MIQTLNRFTTESLFNATSHFLQKLNVEFDRETAEPINLAELHDGPMPAYLTDALQLIDNTFFIGVVNDQSLAGAKTNVTLEDISETIQHGGKYDGMFVFACDAKQDANITRTVASALTRALNRLSLANPVILIIRQGNLISLSTCERMNYSQYWRQINGEKLGKVTMLRNVNCVNLHAGHRQILERVAADVNGAETFEELYKKWMESFSIDILSDAFFDGYKAIYENIIEYVTGKRIVKEGGKWEERDNGTPCTEIMSEFSKFSDPEKAVRDYVKNLMGRLVFIQFLQKKGWMGVPEGDGWEGGDPYFLQNLFANSQYKETFIDDVLEPLFNDLNTKRHGDLVTNQRVGTNIKVPYLNGGLFELDESDDTKFQLPPQFLWDLFGFFASYNFTIDENAPEDVEIGVDPEMLGRIFENLLEDNKEKGAFYTPKEIVKFMSRESLIEYLTTCILKKQGENHKPEKDIHDSVRKLLETPEVIVPRMTKEHLEDFSKYIREVKICDPAIGSGAFPMGLLNELVRCRVIINAWAKDAYGNLLIGDYAALKADIICNNIYGVDIEKGAIDIARLRFWLSIIVDLKFPHALPNFDYKFMQGNSLITTFNDAYVNLDTKNQKHIKVGDMKKEKRRLYELKQQYYASQGEQKHELAVEIKKSILRLVSLQLGYELRVWYEKNVAQTSFDFEGNGNNMAFTEIKNQLPKEKQNLVNYAESLYKQLNDKNIDIAKRSLIDISFFDWRMMFTEVFDVEDGNGGFDIVIGNPPYIRHERLGMEYKKLLTSVYPSVGNGTADILVYFFGLGFDIMKRSGVLTFITSNKFLKTKYGKELRNTLAKYVDVKSFIDFFELPVFHNASTDAGISLLIKHNPISETKYYPVLSLENLNLSDLIKGDFLHTIKNETEWLFIKSEEYSILNKIYDGTISLGEFVDGKIYSGIKTAFNEAFVLSDVNISNSLINSESSNIVKKYAKSTDICTWGLKSYDKYFLATGYDIDIPTLYPTAYAFLQQYEEQLRARCDQGVNWYNLRSCDYYDDFEKEKIIYIHTAKDHQFYFDTEGRYINNSCYMIITDSRFLFCFLNSKLFKYFKKLKFVAYGNGKEAGRCKLDYNKMITVPIKTGVDETPYREIVKCIKNIYSTAPKGEIERLENKINRMIYGLYGLTNAEVKIIDPKESITGNDEDLFTA